ncbi:MAG: serine--tRNA ligase [Candidatus Hodarchaeota archaeon]
MIDIKIFRQNPEIIRESERKRFRDPNRVDEVVRLDAEWRKTRVKIDQLRKDRNQLSKQIGILKKEKEKVDSIVAQVSKIKNKIANLEEQEDSLKKERDKLRYTIGNILHESVPVGEEGENTVVRKGGTKRVFSFTPKGHADLIEGLQIVELKKAAEIAGARTYYLKGDLVFLNFGLLRFALDFLVYEKGFTPFWTPYFMKKEIMEGASELADFENQLYKDKAEDAYFIATSEQTLAALHWNEIINPKDLPLKYAGYSANFRKEAGSHGKDTKGIFRVHQFDKIEQFVFCKAEDSWIMQEELTANAEELIKRLKLPYQIVNIASGELNDNAAKKIDIEVWFPAQQAYRELGSCSNCTDYQARKMNIRVGIVGAGEKENVHTLNSTAIATERLICAILENFQREDGTVEIPKVLQKYVPFNVLKPPDQG